MATGLILHGIGFASRVSQMWHSEKKSTALLFIGILVVRIILAATLNLGDDEALYWALSRKSQVGYVVNPPLFAWLIRASTHLLGSSAFAVRLPGILCATAGLALLLRLVTQLGWTDGRKTTLLLCLCSPLFLFGGILAGPDLPLFACWCALMNQTYAICSTPAAERKQWIKLGIYAGLALLSKYTAAMAVLAVALSLAVSPAARRSLLTRWPFLSAALALAIFSPVLFWNARHNWASFEFQFAPWHAGSQADLQRSVLLGLAQFLLIGPALAGAWFVLVRAGARSKAAYSVRFLAIWAAAPAALLFAQPLFAAIPVLAFWAKAKPSILKKPAVRLAVGLSFWLTITSIFLPLTAGRQADSKQIGDLLLSKRCNSSSVRPCYN